MERSEDKNETSRTAAGAGPSAKSRPESRKGIEDLEFAIEMLRIRIYSAHSISEKLRYYNQIKTLQENIARLREKASSHMSDRDCGKA